jgi:hypothetical protein
MDADDAMAKRRPARRRMWWLASGSVVVLAAIGAGAATLLGAFTGPSEPPGLPTIVFLRLDATEQQKATIGTYLHTLHIIGDIGFETRDQAYQQFMIEFRDCTTLTKDTKPRDLPESFRFVLADPDDLLPMKAHLQNEPGYQRVIAPGALTHQPNAVPCPNR